MAIDTPAKIAILGAGPIGLEAALYARFLGYEVVVFEAGEVAASVRRWGHVRMFTPFGMNCSPLGLAAIHAQDESYRPPADDELLTGQEWIDRYLLPLSQTDLLADHLRLSTVVLSVSKEELLKGDLPGSSERGDFPFRLLLMGDTGERVERFDAVIDCTGVFQQRNWLSRGGVATLAEMELQDQIEYTLPDFAGRDRERYAGKHTLLVGAGMSAATNLLALVELAESAPGTRVTWITRREGLAGSGGPVEIIENDRLPHRLALALRANELASGGSTVKWLPRTIVETIQGRGAKGPFEIELSGAHGGNLPVDQIIANVGFRPNNTIYEELQVHECYATQGPMKLAAALAGQGSADCLDQKACGPQTLLNPEPNFYILGAKSFGRKSNFLLSVGLEQIREVFTIIGDRPTLDLYASAHTLVR